MWRAKGDMDREMLVFRTTEMIQLWADLTMMYQGDFVVLHNFYRLLRQKHAPFPSERGTKYFDDLRQLQMNNPVFDDVIIFQLDKEPIISKIDLRQWKLHVKNEENWKVMGACNVLRTFVQSYEENFGQLQVEAKKDRYEEDENGEQKDQSIPLQIRCDSIKQRIQYLFNFIMNYRSRYSHQIKNKKNKFLLEEHSQSYQVLCERLKESKALMDKLSLAPAVRPHDRQSLRFVNQHDENILQAEDECGEETTSSAGFTLIKLGNISKRQGAETGAVTAPTPVPIENE